MEDERGGFLLFLLVYCLWKRKKVGKQIWGGVEYRENNADSEMCLFVSAFAATLET